MWPFGYTRKISFFFTSARKQLVLLSLFSSMAFMSIAQSFQGYHSSTYTGVYGILTNPTDILNHRFRGDINLTGLSIQANNNLVSIKINNKEDNFIRPNPVAKPAKFNFNTDIFGPSIMMRLSDKHAFAISTRVRVMATVKGIGKDLLNLTIQDSVAQSLVNADISVNDFSINAHAWTELALTYSRQVGISDYGVWKAGISLKYLNGQSAFSLASSGLAFKYTDSLAGLPVARAAITDLRGRINMRYTQNVDSLDGNINNNFLFKNPGLGLDIGLNYEYRDEMQVYETAYSDEIRNYVWKAGVSITDIGFIRYSKQQTGGFAVSFKGNTFLTDTLKPPSDSTHIGQMNNYYRNLFGTRTDVSAITMQLPTALHLTYDRFFNKWLGIQAQLNVPLVFSAANYYQGTYNPFSLIITPRAEISWCGIYLPIAYNSFSGLQVGAAIRLGPLVIGSGSIINTKFLNNSKAGDAYFILRIPFFGYREFKEKIRKERSHLSKDEKKALDCPAAN